MALPSTLTIGQKYKLGGFYLAGTLKPRPTKPWRPDSEPYAGKGVGDIPQYSSGDITIGDTPSAEANQMQWVYVERGGEKLLVGDRVCVVTVPWNTLNTQNLIFGKNITIDGQNYQLRSLTGGTNTNGGSGASLAGTPANEWDDIICNALGLSGLTTPSATDSDGTLAVADFSSANGVMWNWGGVYSWCQDTYISNSANRACRGFSSPRYWGDGGATNAGAYLGFRPVLKILNSAPLISDSDRNLGSYAAPPTVSYTVSEADGDKFSILETLDGTTLRSLTNQSAGAFSIDLTSKWASLANSAHTLVITATDPHGAAGVRTLTFTKTNTAPGVLAINSPLNNMRVPASGYVVFTPTADPDGDAQTFKVQIASNSAFSSGLQTFTTGLQRNDSGTWTNVSQVVAADIGKQFRMPFSGVALNATKYVRVAANDGNATTNSATVTVKSGDVLDIQTYPDARTDKPNSVRIFLRSTLDPAASVQVFACNNGNDASPTWEDCTTDYLAGASHVFANNTKTASSWGVAVHAIITANAATGEISISAIGMGVN